MPLGPRYFRTFHRGLYAGLLETVTVLVREDGLNASNIRTVTLFNARWTRIHKRGQQLDGEVQSDHRRQLHVPTSELQKAQILHINPLCRFIDKEGRYWMPESDNTIIVQLSLEHVCIPVQRTDPIPTIGV